MEGYYITCGENPNEIRRIYKSSDGLWKIQYVRSKQYPVGKIFMQGDFEQVREYMLTRNYVKSDSEGRVPLPNPASLRDKFWSAVRDGYVALNSRQVVRGPLPTADLSVFVETIARGIGVKPGTEVPELPDCGDVKVGPGNMSTYLNLVKDYRDILNRARSLELSREDLDRGIAVLEEFATNSKA